MTLMTPADRLKIEELAEAGMSCGRIAQKISRHPSTVKWFMYCHGLSSPAKLANPKMYVRRGVRVHRFTDAEDTFIENLRADGFTPEDIARQAAARFGTERKHHSIRCRLKMLAAREVE
jgi:IS30 family transposase